jgi:hypothetical protein
MKDMEPADGLERAIEHLHITTRAEADRRILDDAFAALMKPASGEQSGTTAWGIPAIRKIVIPTAVAAAILLAFIFFFHASSQKAVTFGQIQTALARADNVCISTYRAGEAEPFRQEWASKPLGVKLFKIGRGNQAQFTLLDIVNAAKRTKYVSSGYIQTEAISQSAVADLEKSQSESFGLLPFSDANDVPDDAQWSHLDDRQVAAAVPGADVYDLTWVPKSAPAESGMHRLCRLFVDARTRLPKRAEWYTKTTPEDEYGFEVFAVVTYPDQGDIQTVVRSTFGPRPSEEPEYIGTPGADR